MFDASISMKKVVIPTKKRNIIPSNMLMTPTSPTERIFDRLIVGTPFVRLEMPLEERILEISCKRVLSYVWYCGRSARRVLNDRMVAKRIPRITRVATVVMTNTACKSENPLFFSHNRQGRTRRVRMSAIKKMVMTYAVILMAMIMIKMSAMNSSMRSVRDASPGNMIIILCVGYYTSYPAQSFVTVRVVPAHWAS